MKSLSHDFFARPAEQVARDLLGTVLVSSAGGERVGGLIVEAEAYVGPHDEASHASARIGRTQRNEVMFGTPGLAYVYRIYGLHWCLNAVTDRIDFPAAVLIRAARPTEGIEAARQRRGDAPTTRLMRGPANLCSAMGITGALNGHDLTQPPLQIFEGHPIPDSEVATGPRIGITRATELPLRFFLRNEPCVSAHRRQTVGTEYHS